MNEQGERPGSPHGQPAQERRLFGILMALAAVALFFGVYQTLTAIRSPFQPTKRQNTNQQLGETGSLISSLSKKDTDNDGLSDFDELYRYQTSPYLADSDSDTISDKDEVSGGTDPNCAQGTTCSSLAIANVNATNANTNVPFVNGIVSTNQSSGTNTSPTGFTVSDLRKTLLNAGAPASTIDSLSDDELLTMYQEITGTTATLQNSNIAAPTNTSANATNTSATATVDETTLSELTPSQIREFLKAGGADESVLGGVDDETLRSIFQEALSEMQQSQ